MIAALLSIRAHAPLLTIGYALVWANALERQGEGLLGVLVALAHTALVWLWFVGSARAESHAGLGSRLGLSSEPEGGPEEPLAWTSLMLAMFFAGLSLALLVASWRVGLGFLAAGAVLHWHARVAPVALRYRAIEWVAPAAALALPALILSANSGTPGTPGSPGSPMEQELALPMSRVIAASALGGVALGAFFLAAMTRDARRDSLRGVHTIATRLGVELSGALAWAWMLVAMSLAVIGAGWGWWHWSAGVVGAFGASGAAWCFARGRAGVAASVWYVAAVGLSIAIGCSLIVPA